MREQRIRHHTYTGLLLHDVLTDARPSFDPARRKDRLRFLITVRGADGHHALLSWAEIAPDVGRAPVLLAVTFDGIGLEADGSQLVLPQDRCGARCISAIERRAPPRTGRKPSAAAVPGARNAWPTLSTTGSSTVSGAA
jgi:hypothetical protein